MQLKKVLRLGVFLFLSISLLNANSYAVDKTNEIDTIRAELSYIKDKNSPYYIKTKQKLEKIIAKNQIDYTNNARFIDVQRLISEQKYNSAIYELKELIELGFEISKCNELLGDISSKCAYPPKKTAQYFKLAIQYDKTNTEALYKLSKLYLKEKKNILAIEYLKQTIKNTDDVNFLNDIKELILNKITPQNRYEANNLYEALGDIYLKLGYKNEGYEALLKAIKMNPKDIYLKYYLSGMLFEENENDYSLALLESILQENPKDSQIKNLKAKILSKKGYLSQAQEQYQEILKDFPYSNQAKYGIYKIYEDKLEPKEIIKKVYSKDNSYNPSLKEIYAFAEYLKEMEDIKGAQTFENYAKNIEKIEQEKLIKKQQEEKRKEELKAKKAKENNIKQTINQKQQPIKKEVIQKQPQKKETPQKQTPTKQVIKKQPIKKEAKKEIIKKEAQKPKIQNSESKRIVKNKSKKYLELEQTAKKYLSIKPETSENYIAAANTYKQMGEQKIALEYYEKAMKLDPANSDIYYSMGLAQLELDNAHSAKTNLEKAINLDNDNTKARNLLAFVNQKIITQTVNKAYNYYEKKDYIPAFEILDEEIKNYPTNSQLYYYRALIYGAMNRNAAAIIDFQKAIEFDGSNYMAYYQLGKTYEKINDERSALVAYEQFLSIEPDEKDLIEEVQKKVIDFGAKYY